jgi:hypothetical protein
MFWKLDLRISGFRYVEFSSYLEFRTMDKVRKPSDSESVFQRGLSVTFRHFLNEAFKYILFLKIFNVIHQ